MMNKKRIKMFILLFAVVIVSRYQMNVEAAKLKKPSNYIKGIYFGRDYYWDTGKLEITFKPKTSWSKVDSKLKIQVNVYYLNGKKYCSKVLEDSNGWFETIKVPKKDKKVYYCKARVLYNNVPVSTWTKPIYAISAWSKYYKTVAKSINTFQVKTLKIKGIKKYTVKLKYDDIKKIYKKTIKAGSSVTFKNVKIDWYKTANNNISYTDFQVQIEPIYSKKSDKLFYKNKGIYYPITRKIHIKAKDSFIYP